MTVKKILINSAIIAIGILLMQILINPLLNVWWDNANYIEASNQSVIRMMNFQRIAILIIVSIVAGIVITKFKIFK